MLQYNIMKWLNVLILHKLPIVTNIDIILIKSINEYMNEWKSRN